MGNILKNNCYVENVTFYSSTLIQYSSIGTEYGMKEMKCVYLYQYELLW